MADTVTASPPAPARVTTLTAPYAVRKIDCIFTLGTGSFGGSGMNQLTVSGLRVYVHLSKIVSPHMFAEVLLRVYGMTLDHMNQISVAGLLFQGRQNNLVQVRAGDDDTGMTTLANATIQEAYPVLSGDPDNRHFYVYAAGLRADIQLKPTQPTSYTGSVQAKQILNTLTGQIGYSLQDSGVTAVLQTPYFPGTVWQQIQAVVKAADCFAYIDEVNKNLIIWPKNATSPPDVVVTVSPATGMIDYPMFQKRQIIVRTLFSPSMSVTPGVGALVQSSLGAANNARITINRVTHDLESQMPDGPWETMIMGTPLT